MPSRGSGRGIARGDFLPPLFLFLAAAVGAAQATPSIFMGGAVNAASYASGARLAPGSLVAVFGSFGVGSAAQSATLPLPTVLNGLSAQFGSSSAPLVYVSDRQVNLQVPWELTAQTQSALAVSVNSQTGNSLAVGLAPFAPGLFSLNAQGSGQGAILGPAYQVVDSANPAIAGGTIIQIYCTGLGPVTNQPASGAPAPSGPFAETTTTPIVTVGRVPAHVLFSGLAPGLVGVYQVNALVPPGAPAGKAVPVVIAMAGFVSNTVTMAVASGGSAPGPSITSLSPPSAAAGSSPQVVTISGSNFASDAQVLFNGLPRPVSFLDSAHLTVTLSASDLALPEKFAVIVANLSQAASSSASSFVVQPVGSTGWTSFGRDAQHSAVAPAATQRLDRIRWQTAVDLNPQLVGGELDIHYGSPLVTPANTVILPVKTGASDGFRVEARQGSDGALVWALPSDYVLPPHQWTPEFGPALASASRVYLPGIGGKVYFRDNPDAADGPSGELAYYGLSNYQQKRQAYDSNVIINTPISSDPAGNIYFGFLVTGPTPLQLTSGIARIGADGRGTWIPVTTAAGDAAMTGVAYNCAPAVNWDLGTLYVAVSNGDIYVGTGYLVVLDSETLAPLGRVRLKDPKSGLDATLANIASSAPTIGTDGDVYFGVLENPEHENHDRGWLLHFDSRLSQTKTPGAFGWDEAVSLVPSAAVPSYAGRSTYLLMTKYNDYGGNGSAPDYRIAIVDPNATETDPITGATVMQEVLSISGVQEWCIDSAAVDAATHSVLANSEDGKLYRWDLATNTFSQSLVLSPGLAEAYTPTIAGPDGAVYAINNAILFAVGQ